MWLMLPRNSVMYWGLAAVAVLLAACNRPELVRDPPTSTPRPLTLEEIETVVVATLLAEGEMTATVRPSEPPVPDSPSPTPTNTSTPTPTVTPSPSDKPTFAPPTNTLAPAPTSTPSPTDKPTSAPPTVTPCPEFTNATLSARVINSNNDVSLAWGSTGGCASYEGSLTAIYKGDGSPYATYSVKASTGKLTDLPKLRCEGTFTIAITSRCETAQVRP